MKRIVLILLLSIGLAACDAQESWPVEKFNPAVWKSLAEKERYKFAHDIVSSRRLIGKSKSEVVDLLGPPSSESDGSDLTYLIKTGGKGFNKIFILDIRFDNEKVQEVLIRGD